MSTIKRLGDGYYVCAKYQKEYRTQFLIIGSGNGCGNLYLNNVVVPKELIGKKIMLRVEIISKII